MPSNESKWVEIGTSGLQQYFGFVQEAFHADLRWPSCQPLYARIRRSDPEISIVRILFTSLARGLSLEWQLPDNPSDDDKRAQEFAEQSLDDMDGGAMSWIEQLVSNVPFYGWGWWEAVPGVRDQAWTPPGDDDWRSSYADGLIGLRRLAWRDSSSFEKWQLSETGKLLGMYQRDMLMRSTLMPVERSLHITYGDNHNPEGLATLEAIWRLERIKYGLEMIQGIGFEHAAGYLDVKVPQTPDAATNTAIAKAARAVMTAQEGNYAVWPGEIVGEVKDVTFGAAGALLEAIKYFGILKLSVFGMQWVALSATTGAGSYASMSDASGMAVLIFNSMMDGFIEQADQQIGKRLFQWNAGAFPGMTRRPRLTISHVNKDIPLAELGAFATALNAILPLSEADLIAIRKRTDILPDSLGEPASEPEPEPEPTPEEPPIDEEAPTDEQAVAQSLARYQAWAREHDPEGYALLTREVE